MASREQGQRTRARLITAAGQSFAEFGFAGTSLDAVATAAGVSRQGLLYYFPNKVDLLGAVLDERDLDDARTATEVAQQGSADLAAALLAIVRRNRERPEVAQLLAISAGEGSHPAHPAHAYARQRAQRVRELMRDAIVGEQRRGKLPAHVDPDVLAVALSALLTGLNLQQLTDPTADTVAALILVMHAVTDSRPAAEVPAA